MDGKTPQVDMLPWSIVGGSRDFLGPAHNYYFKLIRVRHEQLEMRMAASHGILFSCERGYIYWLPRSLLNILKNA
jgi:hypothetical protein